MTLFVFGQDTITDRVLYALDGVVGGLVADDTDAVLTRDLFGDVYYIDGDLDRVIQQALGAP